MFKNSNPYYWMWGGKSFPIELCGTFAPVYVTVNRWLSIRFNLLSAGIVGATGLACLITPTISASMAGFALAFASTITNDLLFMVRRFVGLEQSMVRCPLCFFGHHQTLRRSHWSESKNIPTSSANLRSFWNQDLILLGRLMGTSNAKILSFVTRFVWP
jgi:hypothetical protein